MTKSAWLFLTLALATAGLGLNVVSQDAQTVAFVVAGVFGSLWVLAIIIGRRIKFDPVLR
ncbi:PA3371 family protein [Pseudomonas sp. Z18(2022)]|uniref:PA3371 family protein n=1 Tax=Pseudomonas sp. Z18(2022) TaxID=2983410 RepID=UPI002E820C73|nr:PA3371 family protein [Pseudomonas sp. Z18(2022)]